ncbi:MAG: DUF853 family protein, partial [Clostridia bacterium]|nr:DUF853 family protein [Clostridia bacterium]
RVQHALRAYTPNEQKNLRYAARSFRVNPDFDTERVLQELATGEALVSVLDPKGTPGIVQRAGILPPRSSMNAVDAAVIGTVVANSPLAEKYGTTVDRESAFEVLTGQQEEAAAKKAEAEAAKKAEEERKAAEKLEEQERKKKEKEEKAKASARKKKNSSVGKVFNSTLSSFGRELGRQIFRGLLGNRK